MGIVIASLSISSSVFADTQLLEKVKQLEVKSADCASLAVIHDLADRKHEKLLSTLYVPKTGNLSSAEVYAHYDFEVARRTVGPNLVTEIAPVLKRMSETDGTVFLRRMTKNYVNSLKKHSDFEANLSADFVTNIRGASKKMLTECYQEKEALEKEIFG